MEYEIAVGSWRDGQGALRRFHYYLLVETVEAGSFCCENYGVKVSEEGGGSAAVPGITTSAVGIDRLMTLLVDHRVGPAALADVVEDWLCA